MEITSAYNVSLDTFSPRSAERPAGLHVSTIIYAAAQDLYPKWFKQFEEDEEAKERQIAHFQKGLVLEEAWGTAMSQMLPGFERPEPKQKDGIWCSPDGYLKEELMLLGWPFEYPEHVAPAIHECKVTLKSCNQDTSPIEHEKYITWLWQIMAYCFCWNCFTAYIYVLHLCGDYKERPWTPMCAVHRFDFTAPELAQHWQWLIEQARERGLYGEEQEAK